MATKANPNGGNMVEQVSMNLLASKYMLRSVRHWKNAEKMQALFDLTRPCPYPGLIAGAVWQNYIIELKDHIYNGFESSRVRGRPEVISQEYAALFLAGIERKRKHIAEQASIPVESVSDSEVALAVARDGRQYLRSSTEGKIPTVAQRASTIRQRVKYLKSKIKNRN